MKKTQKSAENNGFFTQNVLIDIDIFKSDLIDIDIFKTCRYIDNRYGLSIYRTPLDLTHAALLGVSLLEALGHSLTIHDLTSLNRAWVDINVMTH